MPTDTREIYSIQDCLDVVEEILEKELGLGFYIIQAISKIITKDFEHTNWNRFKHANCVGCAGSPNDCDINYGRGDHIGVWQKINAGKVQSCPARTGGTMTFSHEEGLRDIDIADHKFNVVEPMGEEEKPYKPDM